MPCLAAAEHRPKPAAERTGVPCTLRPVAASRPPLWHWCVAPCQAAPWLARAGALLIPRAARSGHTEGHGSSTQVRQSVRRSRGGRAWCAQAWPWGPPRRRPLRRVAVRTLRACELNILRPNDERELIRRRDGIGAPLARRTPHMRLDLHISPFLCSPTHSPGPPSRAEPSRADSDR